MNAENRAVTKLLAPHRSLLDFYWSRFQGFRYRSKSLVSAAAIVALRSTRAYRHWSTHPLSRELRLNLLSFSFCVLQSSKQESVVEYELREAIYQAALAWFAEKPTCVRRSTF